MYVMPIVSSVIIILLIYVLYKLFFGQEATDEDLETLETRIQENKKQIEKLRTMKGGIQEEIQTSRELQKLEREVARDISVITIGGGNPFSFYFYFFCIEIS